MDLILRDDRAKTSTSSRVIWLDSLRGVAICAMLLYHQAWNMAYFGLVNWNMTSEISQSIARTIGSLFLLLVGTSLFLSYTRRRLHFPDPLVRRQLIRRGLIILGWGILVSLATAFVLEDWVAFGILHLIGVSVIVGALLVGRFPYPWAIGVGILLWGLLPFRSPSTSPWLLPLGVGSLSRTMVDYYPLVPWLGMVMIGLSLGGWAHRKGWLTARTTNPSGAFSNVLAACGFIGRHSLVIYLIHQPLLFGVTALIGYIGN